MDILAKEGLDVRVIVIPDNMDPDDYAKKFGGQEYLALKDKALTLNGFKLDSLMGGIDLGTPDGREEYSKKSLRTACKAGTCGAGTLCVGYSAADGPFKGCHTASVRHKRKSRRE